MNFKKLLIIFLISMVPIVELRGSIPLGATSFANTPALDFLPNYIASVLGNFLPVPFILLFIRKILQWMKSTKHFSKIALWLEKKAKKGSDKVMRYASLGLFLFVAIPLPGTGAWTGALIASLLNMRMKYALPSILVGVLVAGAIMTCATYFFKTALAFLL